MPGAPDVIWLNGAFGVGKTTVAEVLVEQVNGATLIDPELVGALLRVLVPPDWQTENFQDMPFWRSLTREAIGGLVSAGHGPLVIPMTLVRLDYFDEIIGALRRNDVDVRHFALHASTETIISRLNGRDGDGAPWARGRVADCVVSLTDPRFAVHVDAEECDPAEIAAEIADRLAA